MKKICMKIHNSSNAKLVGDYKIQCCWVCIHFLVIGEIVYGGCNTVAWWKLFLCESFESALLVKFVLLVPIHFNIRNSVLRTMEMKKSNKPTIIPSIHRKVFANELYKYLSKHVGKNNQDENLPFFVEKKRAARQISEISYEFYEWTKGIYGLIGLFYVNKPTYILDKRVLVFIAILWRK